MSEEGDVNIESLDESPTLEDTPVELDNSNKAENATKDNSSKPIRLPLARIKHIMKADPDCTLVSQDALYLVTKATEMFIEFLGKEAAKHTCNTKRKTVMRRDVDTAIDNVSHLCFLEGALE